MLERIEEPTKNIAKILNEDSLKNCYATLKDYSKNAELHHNELVKIQKEWKNIILPEINNIDCL